MKDTARKQYEDAPEPELPEPKAKATRISKASAPASARASVVRMSGTQVAEDEIMLEP